MIILCAKEIGQRLGISERSATRLLKGGEIAGFRAGAKLWRTTELHLESYVSRRLDDARAELKAKSGELPPGVRIERPLVAA